MSRSILSTRVLRRRVPINPKRLRNGIGFLALCGQRCDLLANFNPEPRAANLHALGLSSGHARLRAITDFLGLNLGQGREQRQ